jgi:hypothetical protein
MISDFTGAETKGLEYSWFSLARWLKPTVKARVLWEELQQSKIC